MQQAGGRSITLAARKRMLSRDSHEWGIKLLVIHALQKPFASKLGIHDTGRRRSVRCPTLRDPRVRRSTNRRMLARDRRRPVLPCIYLCLEFHCQWTLGFNAPGPIARGACSERRSGTPESVPAWQTGAGAEYLPQARERKRPHAESIGAVRVEQFGRPGVAFAHQRRQTRQRQRQFFWRGSLRDKQAMLQRRAAPRDSTAPRRPGSRLSADALPDRTAIASAALVRSRTGTGNSSVRGAHSRYAVTAPEVYPSGAARAEPRLTSFKLSVTRFVASPCRSRAPSTPAALRR